VTPQDPIPALLRSALDGDAGAVRALVDHLTPVVQARVARALLRRERGAAGRDVRQEVEDIAQEVFVSLFEDGGRVLRTWRADGGLSLRNFVGLVAERQAASILRSGRRSPWTEDPTLQEDLDRDAGESAAPEAGVVSRDLMRAVLEHLREQLSPQGLHIFQRLLVEERSVEEVCAELSMTPDAVYAWKSRLGKLVRKLAQKLSSESWPPRPIPFERAR
jgi:RNA polymerase sigma-70 factor (ECF subfamily)